MKSLIKKKLKFIHIGHHKTGSTFIQQQVIPNLVQFKQPSGKNKFNLSDIDYRKALIDICTKTVGNFDKHIVNKQFQKKEFNCISHEGFVGFSKASGTGHQFESTAKNLFSVFEVDDIILVIRNQKDLVRSLYIDDIEYGYTCSFKKWLNIKVEHNQLDWLKFHDIIKIYSDVFGSNKVNVILYEDLFNLETRMETLKKFFRKNKVSEKEFKKLNFEIRSNPSLNFPAVYVSRLLNYFIGTHANYAEGFLYKLWYKKLMKTFSRYINFSSTKKISKIKEFDSILNSLFSKDNIKTSKLIKKNLNKYNYP